MLALRSWRLGPEATITAHDGPIARAIDEVFAAFSIDGDSLPARHAVRLSLDDTLTLRADGAAIVRLGSEAGLAPLLEGSLLGLAVRTRRDAVPLHAASLSIDGRTLLLIGQKGSGKSTLALWLAEHAGAIYRGDEITFVRFSDRRLDVFPKAATLKSGSFELFDFAGSAPIHHDPVRGPVRYRLPASAVKAGSDEHLAPLSLIVLPHYTPDVTLPQVTRLTPPETALELVQQCFGGLERDPLTLGVVAALAATPAFAVEFSAARDAETAIRQILAEEGSR
jgi:hypothetical protein